jgi:dienelactone hydrolase
MVRTFVLIAAMGLVPKIVLPTATPVVLTTRDGVTIAADVYTGPSPIAPVILLFHQAGSGKSEYASIAPRLVLLGYSAIAIDQRSGGALYTPANATVARLGHSAPYLDVLRDMDAAFAYARRLYPIAPIYLWGSSYSASLAFAFAAKHPRDVGAVLAFSPGEYFPNKHLVRDAARSIRMPVFIDSSSDPQEERAAREIGDATRSKLKVDFVPHAGVHGSSTLRDDKNAAGSAENWDAVTGFLARVRALGP